MHDDHINRRLRNMLTAALAYGGGLALGSIVIQLLFRLLSLRHFQGYVAEDVLFVIGLLLVFAVAMLGGGIGGFLGGYTLPTVDRPRGRWGYAWRSALSLGIPFGTIFYFLTFIVYSLVVGDLTAISPEKYAVLFAILGAILGTVVGLFLGLLTVGKRFWRVALAGALGFGLGGTGLGLGYWAFLNTIPIGGLAREGSYPVLLLGVFAFGLGGGAALGYAYDRLAYVLPHERKILSRRVKFLLGLAVLLLAAWKFWPMLTDVEHVFVPRDAHLSQVLDTDAVGTHWTDPADLPFAQGALSQSLAARDQGRLALAWTGGEAVHLAFGQWTPQGAAWDPPLALPAAQPPYDPQAALDASGAAHLLWLEGTEAGDQRLLYARCQEGQCTEPAPVAEPVGAACRSAPTEAVQGLALTVAADGTILAVWEEPGGGLEFATWSSDQAWPGDQAAPAPNRGCLPPSGRGRSRRPRLSAGPDGSFALAFEQGDRIALRRFAQGAWADDPETLGTGDRPEIRFDGAGQAHIAWCDGGKVLRHWAGGTPETVAQIACLGRPALGVDDEGRLHIVFASDRVQRSSGGWSSLPVLYESFHRDGAWTLPMIVARPGVETQPALAADGRGVLHLVWSEETAPGLRYASQRRYTCRDVSLPPLAETVLQVANESRFRSPDNPLAYCRNRYDRLIYAPNPAPPFSDQEPAVNGAFDKLAELAATADYEVLLATMAYDEGAGHTSPGVVLGRTFADLYERLKANPEQFPRGLTVRFLLGNSPPVSSMELDSQLWLLLRDLRAAGIETMEDPEIGWRLEVANYEGAFPHSHSKLLVVDGKSVIASGFNFEFRPMPVEHPSGLGKGDTDLGIQFTGPVAQDARRVFDELWEGSVQRECRDLDPAYRPWETTCRDRAATVDHVPEVVRYYVADGEAIAISMFRSNIHPAADQEVYALLASAQESVDVMHVSFSFPLLCDLNHFYDLCTYDQAPEYMEKLLQAAENGAHVRVLVGALPFQGIENVVAVDLLRREAEKRGVGDRIEFRFFQGLLHTKSLLVDNEFLVIGSQNLHYSAFGPGNTLTEYSIGTTDPQAIEDYRRLFEYHWARAAPPED